MGNCFNTEEEIYLLSEHVHPLDKGFELFPLNYRQNDWAEADRVADYILSMAERSYNSRQKWGDVVPLNQMLKHPLIFYFGYAIDLLSGNKEILKEYNEFIQENDEETLPGFITIFEAANINEWNIDEYYYNIPDQLAIYNINQQRYGIAIVTAKAACISRWSSGCRDFLGSLRTAFSRPLFLILHLSAH